METIKVLKAYGTHFDVGYTLGKDLKKEIKHTLDDTSGQFQRVLRPFYETGYGRKACQELLESARETYPQYIEEMTGIAEGSGTDFMQIFLLNCGQEITLLSGSHGSGEGCSTVFLHTEDTAVLAHNEDMIVGQTGVWLCAHIFPDPAKPKQEAIFAFCYAGILAGGQTGFNMHGLAMTENFLLPKHVNTKGIPRKVLDRAMLSAANIDEAIARACKGAGFAFGGSNNFAQNVDGNVTMANIEFYSSDGHTCYDKSDIKENNVDFHFNEYKRAQIDYLPDISTQSRMMRISDILKKNGKPKTLTDVLQILGDDTEKSLPVYRTGDPPDTLATTFTVNFNLREKVLAVYTSNPQSSQPDLIPFTCLLSRQT